MSKSPLLIVMEVHFLRDFLEDITSRVVDELNGIEEKTETGEMADYGDYEHAMDYPLFRAEFAAKLIYYELNSLVESVLQDLATPAWYREVGPQPGDRRGWKTVEDQKLAKIIGLVEKEYGISLDNVPEWSKFGELRKCVNSFKHRRGSRRYSELERNPETGGIEFEYKATLEEAEEYLDTISSLLNTLLSISGSESSYA